MDYFLRSQRLGFRCWSEEDLALAMDICGDSEMTVFAGGPFEREAVRARLLREIESMREHRMQYWPVFLLDGDRHVGCVGLRIYDEEERIYELGFYVRRVFWGQGLAQEASRAIIDYGFSAMGANALFAGHDPLNAASRHVLLSVGFSFAGEEIYPPTGIPEPTYRLRKPPNQEA